MIERCLRTVLADAEPGEFDVVVACNGCTDDTAAIARSVPGVRVVETATASKIAALNLGDESTSVLPRVYLDADITLTTHSLRLVVTALEAGALAAAPSPVIDSRACGPATRAYFSVWSRLGYVQKNIIGSGVYGLSAAGRARFDEFPDLIADDGFVYSLFAPQERINPSGATFTVRAPRTLRATLKRRVRITLGNLQLTARTGRTMQVPGPGWRDVVRAEPRLLPAAVIYVIVNAIATTQARARLRKGATYNWNRDDSTREAGQS